MLHPVHYEKGYWDDFPDADSEDFEEDTTLPEEMVESVRQVKAVPVHHETA